VALTHLSSQRSLMFFLHFFSVTGPFRLVNDIDIPPLSPQAKSAFGIPRWDVLRFPSPLLSDLEGLIGSSRFLAFVCPCFKGFYTFLPPSTIESILRPCRKTLPPQLLGNNQSWHRTFFRVRPLRGHQERVRRPSYLIGNCPSVLARTW